MLTITKDGTYKVNGSVKGSSACILYVSGAAATITLGYGDGLTFVPLTDGTLVVGSQYKVDCGSGMNLLAQVSGVTGPLNIVAKGAK